MAGNLFTCQSIQKSCHLKRTKTDGTDELCCSEMKLGTQLQFFTLIYTRMSPCSFTASTHVATYSMENACLQAEGNGKSLVTNYVRRCKQNEKRFTEGQVWSTWWKRARKHEEAQRCADTGSSEPRRSAAGLRGARQLCRTL